MIIFRQVVDLLNEALEKHNTASSPDWAELQWLVGKVKAQVGNNDGDNNDTNNNSSFLRYEDVMECRAGVSLNSVMKLKDCPTDLIVEVKEIIESLVSMSKKHRPMWH